MTGHILILKIRPAERAFLARELPFQLLSGRLATMALVSLYLDASSARRRYEQKAAEVRAFQPGQSQHLVTSTGVKTEPFDAGYPDADLFLGSHVEDSGGGENRIHVLSYRSGQVMDEGFVERTERPHLFSKKTRVLHAYAVQYQSPGGTPLAAALTSIDLRTGEVLRHETEGQAFDHIQPLEARRLD